MYLLKDGTEVTKDQIKTAFAEGTARLVHCRADGGTSTGLLLNGEDVDTRDDCYSVWDEVWTTTPRCLWQALNVARA